MLCKDLTLFMRLISNRSFLNRENYIFREVSCFHVTSTSWDYLYVWVFRIEFPDEVIRLKLPIIQLVSQEIWSRAIFMKFLS